MIDLVSVAQDMLVWQRFGIARVGVHIPVLGLLCLGWECLAVEKVIHRASVGLEVPDWRAID